MDTLHFLGGQMRPPSTTEFGGEPYSGGFQIEILDALSHSDINCTLKHP